MEQSNRTQDLGRMRGLQRLTDVSGVVRILALDHGASFARRLADALGRRATREEILHLKSMLAAELARGVGGVVCDPDGFLEVAIARGLIPGPSGLIAGFADVDRHLAAGYRDQIAAGVDRTAALGCDAVKLCLEVEPRGGLQPFLRLAEQVAARSHANGMAAIVEVVAPQEVSARRGAWPALVPGSVEFARNFASVGADLLKLGFPGRPTQGEEEVVDACRAITEAACGVPWVLLSAGSTYEAFERRLELACRGGAAGFVAGTAIWQESLDMSSDGARKGFLSSTGIERLSRLSAIVTASAGGVAGRADAASEIAS